jgi:hypothetical protein
MKRIAIAALTLMLTDCASTLDQRSDDREAKKYRTGSNLPVRDRTARAPIQSTDVSLEQVRVPPTMRSFGKNE